MIIQCGSACRALRASRGVFIQGRGIMGRNVPLGRVDGLGGDIKYVVFYCICIILLIV